MTAEDVVRRSLQTWNADDRAGHRATYADSAVVKEHATGREIVGGDAIADAHFAWRAAFAALGCVAAVLALVEPLLPLDLGDRLGLSSLAIGLVFGAGLLAYFALVPVAGRWSDRRGRRLPLILGGILIATGLPFLAMGTAATVAVAFAVVGAGMAALGAPSAPLMVEAVDEAGMTGRYGLSAATLTVVFALGYSLGPLLGAAASVVVPFQVTVLVAAAATLVLTFWVSRALPR